ncbi:uncharacterized protein PHA67_003717 [Liasis olivaceus]
MKLVILCLLSWPWTPGAAPSRGLGHTGNLQMGMQVRDRPGLAWSRAEGGAPPGPPVSASDLKVTISQGAAGKGSPPPVADDQSDWDFDLVLIAISVAALILIIHCCFHWKCNPWCFSCLHPAWQGWMGNHRHLLKISFIGSLQRYGTFASRTPQGLAAESNRDIQIISSELHGKPLVHFRRESTGVPMDGPVSLSAAASGNATGCGPTSETILEMEDEL